VFVGDFRNVYVTVVKTGFGEGNIRVRGSKDTKSPNFSSASSITNSYADLVMRVEGETGTDEYVTILPTPAGTHVAEVNTNNINWISIRRSSEGLAPQIFITETNNQ
jgi:hypothetical protein